MSRIVYTIRNTDLYHMLNSLTVSLFGYLGVAEDDDEDNKAIQNHCDPAIFKRLRRDILDNPQDKLELTAAELGAMHLMIDFVSKAFLCDRFEPLLQDVIAEEEPGDYSRIRGMYLGFATEVMALYREKMLRYPEFAAADARALETVLE